MSQFNCVGTTSFDSSGTVATCSTAWVPGYWFPLSQDELNDLVLALVTLGVAIYFVKLLIELIKKS